MRAFVAILSLSLVLVGTASAKTFSARTLSNAHIGRSKPELLAQEHYSGRIVHRLAGSWQVAPRHSTCWTHVPWARLCDQSRHKLILHRHLLRRAERLYERLYAFNDSIPWAFWNCVATGRLNGVTVSRGEGGATSVDSTGTYYGRYQMDSTFMSKHGPDMLAKYHGQPASDWDVYDQTIVAERGFLVQGPGAWPNTAPPCLSLR